MDAICLIVAATIRATLPERSFTLAWEHSVQKTRWEEAYALDGTALVLTEARVQGGGAGMEPPPGARFDGGWWIWQPRTRLPELRLARSEYGGDYTLCSDECRPLAAILGDAGQPDGVVIRPCADPAPAAGVGPPRAALSPRPRDPAAACGARAR